MQSSREPRELPHSDPETWLMPDIDRPRAEALLIDRFSIIDSTGILRLLHATPCKWLVLVAGVVRPKLAVQMLYTVALLQLKP